MSQERTRAQFVRLMRLVILLDEKSHWKRIEAIRSDLEESGGGCWCLRTIRRDLKVLLEVGVIETELQYYPSNSGKQKKRFYRMKRVDQGGVSRAAAFALQQKTA